jgi:ribokinase
VRLLAYEFQEARRVLERLQPHRRFPPRARGAGRPPDRGDRARRANQTADRKRPKACPPTCTVHATIVLVRLTTIGDLLLDVIVQLDDPLVVGDDRVARTITSPGGQAANVAAWAAALGATARFVGCRGSDAAGEIVEQALAGRGVEIVGPRGGRTGVVVSIAASGDRTLASDRGTAVDLRPGDLDPAWFDCDVLHVSGYALVRDPIASAAARAAELAHSHGATVSCDVSTWSPVDDGFRGRLHSLEPELTFATEREQQAVGTLETRWVVKRGPDGIRVDGVDHPAHAGEIVDTTGAGDALAAGFLVGGVVPALEAAARCCARLGAMP